MINLTDGFYSDFYVDKNVAGCCADADLLTKSVGVFVDKMFAVLCRPCFIWLSEDWLKNAQISLSWPWIKLKPSYLAAFSGFPQKSGKMPDLHTKSVGASVDKVFAVLYRPLKTWLVRFRLKNDQRLPKQTFLDKSRILFKFHQCRRCINRHLPTFAVGGSVDKLFAKVCKARFL